jgi:hypothetical protein
MRLVRRVAAGLLLGALIGFLAALLRPRRVSSTAPTRGAASPQAGPGHRSTPAPAERMSPTVKTDPATRPLGLPVAATPPAARGTA